MPYITKKAREEIAQMRTLTNAGELNYYITNVCLAYIIENKLKYQTINDIIGALEGVKLELYRRFFSHYEDKKILENGDLEWSEIPRKGVDNGN